MTIHDQFKMDESASIEQQKTIEVQDAKKPEEQIQEKTLKNSVSLNHSLRSLRANSGAVYHNKLKSSSLNKKTLNSDLPVLNEYPPNRNKNSNRNI